MDADSNRWLPWGGWATAGLGLVILVVFLVAQVATIVVAMLGLALFDSSMDVETLAESIQGDGDFLTLGTFGGTAPAALLVLFFAWLKARKDWRSYLSLRESSSRDLALSLAAVVLFLVCADSLTLLLGRSIVPEFASTAYHSADYKLPFWLAVCLIAPIFEELFVRGFLITGWLEARFLGPVGAVLLSSLLWTLLHVQYGAYELVHIFLFGIVLGTMRVKTGSLLAPVACHALANTVATFETVLLTSG